MGPFDGAGMGTPWGSSMSPTKAVHCEASMSEIPASSTLNRVGGPLWNGPMMGGSANENTNSELYIAPTAGYSHLQNPGNVIQTSAGTMEMVNIPMNARTMNQCLSGGKRKK